MATKVSLIIITDDMGKNRIIWDPIRKIINESRFGMVPYL